MSIASAESKSDCGVIAAGSLVAAYPASENDAQSEVEDFINSMSEILNRKDPYRGLEKMEIGSFLEDTDPLQYCVNSNFNFEIYIADNDGGEAPDRKADIQLATSLTYAVAVRAFPYLNYVAPHLLSVAGNRENVVRASDAAAAGYLLPEPLARTVRRPSRKIRLGIASAMFGPSSVTTDFGNTLARLPRDEFEIAYIDVIDLRPGPSPFLIQRQHAGDRVVTIRPVYAEAEWLESAREEIAALNLDVLFYLDLTMSNKIQRLAMARLAHVQCTSHGHPITSGITSEVMDYFISWRGAELPYGESKKHYTESLVLLPSESIHQYYTSFLTPDGTRSATTGISYQNMPRDWFAQVYKLPTHAPDGPPTNWYLCMQKPFKRHPKFDAMISRILTEDLQAIVLLHDLFKPSVENHKIIVKRLEGAGADMSRVFFLPTQPHHQLLALYSVSDVVLDSYAAGGCTTTREALEIGAAVVTLPAPYLGGRWSLGLLSVAGIIETVAKDVDDYVEIAVRIAKDKDYQVELKGRIKKAAQKLFRREEAVEHWAEALRKIAYSGRTGGGGVMNSEGGWESITDEL